MAKVLIYSKNSCPYCDRAKLFLNDKGIAYDEKLLTEPDEMIALKQKTGWMTFPQIFINDKLIGGYTDLVELDQKGELEKLLA